MSVLSQENRSTAAAAASHQEVDQVERALIDASARTPVLCFYASALFWLLIQTVLGLVVNLKLQWPGFLAECAPFTYGRIVPVQSNLLLYGWASLAGLGTAIWVLSRLCRVLLPRGGYLIAAVGLWNAALVAGTLELLAGNGRGFQYLEYPRYVYGMLFAAYTFTAVWGVVLFARRREGHVYISAWYLMAALFWFPWLLGVANLLLPATYTGGVEGVVQAIVSAWYAQNVIGLWLGALGLGVIYYLIPKVVGRPIHSYNLASVGFWTFALFSVWSGIQRLTGGPIPAWMITVSVVSAILMLIPVAMVTANYFLTLKGDFNLVYHSPTIRFVFFGAIAYTLANVLFFLSSFRTIGRATQFSWFAVGVDQFFIFAFFTMVMFGAMYYIIPRLVGCEWLSATFIKLHFWGTAYGFGLGIVMLLIGGYAQGAMQLNIHQTDPAVPQADFLLSLDAVMPFLRGQGLAQIPLFIGLLFFSLHFLLMLLRLGRPSGPQPTLFEPIQEGAK